MTAGVLWLLLAFFLLRVLGQALVAFFDVGFLPPMASWYSGLMPYEYLLPAQIAIVALMAKISVDFTRRSGFFYDAKKPFATVWLWFGYLYLAAMLARALLLWDRPIPILFHWVLAAFVIIVGRSHRQRLAP
ncbi:MAG TPA: hypothetical protein VFR66_00355 [Burkholderiales bacterium]|nr:hypothetical protein [Burkholderiales bacterium]